MIKNNKNLNSCFKAGGVLFCIFVAVFFTVFGATFAQAQTAMVTSVSVNYPKTDEAYPNYQCDLEAPTSVSFLYDPDILQEFDNPYNTLHNNADPWHNSALIEFDQPYPLSLTGDATNYYPNHCLRLCATVTCANPSRKVEASDGSSNSSLILTQDVASSPFPIQSVLFEIFKYQPNSNPYNADSTPPIRTIALTPVDNNICYGVGTYITNSGTANEAMNSCCDLFNTSSEDVATGSCQSSTCSGITSQSTCMSTTGCYWKSQTKCYTKTDAASQSFCTGRGKASCQAKWGCEWINSNNTCVDKCSKLNQSACGLAQNCIWENRGACNTSSSDPCVAYNTATECTSNGCTWKENTITGIQGCDDTLQHFSSLEECIAGTTVIPFCTAWDGSYEIDGEFGKSNGQFGFRANVKTKWPGDGISSGGDVDVDHTMAYPGENQIPIQVDVTNVHSVRSSSTMVGTTTKVPAQPYNITYKLSKDATTTINISDPIEPCSCSVETSEGTLVGYDAYQCANGGSSKPVASIIKFPFVNEQPRLGEGIPNGVNTNLDSWDGRDDQGVFLPYGNYLVDITASTKDEWTNGSTKPFDISRTVTRQLSLEPLKITDIKETGLAKLSTSYAKIDYVLTEAATVHIMIFAPGTSFDSSVYVPTSYSARDYILNHIAQPQGQQLLVDEIVEQKQGRVGVNTKWDGVCRNAQGCMYNGQQYNAGTPMPDGDYVYVMWAEIPYAQGHYVCVNKIWWSGVKTRRFYNGILPINRGLPEITVGAVGYTTIGSSPTAFGLDPFTFTYSVSRDSIVDATIKTTAVDFVGAQQVYEVKKLLTNEVAVASKQNKFTWDGIDDQGYQVAPGTYMVEFVAKDSLYPEKQATMTVQFPVDLFRVVDVNTTSLLDEATAQANISYTLSKSVDVIVEIYDQTVTIPTEDCKNPSDPDENCWCKYDVDNQLLPVVGATPIKSFTLPKAGEGMTITEVWDGLKQSTGPNDPVAPLPDGNYPYRICTRTTQDISHWYGVNTNNDPVAQDGHAAANLYKDGASDKPTGFITIARGSIAFTKVLITPSQPTMKYSSETIYLPSYEVGFSTSRPASVNIEVISTQNGQCEGGAVAGTTCRTLSTYIYGGTDGYFDPTKIYKVYWDGKDSKGEYVKYGSYEIKLVGLPYPMPAPSVFGDLPKETIYSQVISVNNFQVYDRYVEDITRDNPTAKFAYQISVPMKVAIQIFKPGTTTNRDAGTATATGLVDPVTINDPTTHGNVPNDKINDVLVKSIVGVRPNLVSIDEVWDGTDYAGQEVPDGIYPYRYVTVFNAYDMDSVTGALNHITPGTNDNLATAGAMIADWEKYITLEHINVARGDSWYADVDWKSKKVTSFFPNPLSASEGWFEIAKLPAPGKVTIKIYNIAGDLVRSGGYDCINAKMESATLEQINNGYFGDDFGLQPYMNLTAPTTPQTTGVSRNFTLRCKWDKTNDHGKAVARGLYYAIMELNPTRGNAKKSQRVIKILIP